LVFIAKDSELMKVFKSYQLNVEKLDGQLQRYAKSEGLIIKKPVENLIDYKILLRPFKKVTFDVESSVTNLRSETLSFIDEKLSSFVGNENHRMLLWRPKYAKAEVIEDDHIDNTTNNSGSDAVLQEVVDQMIDHRWACQALDEEYRPKLKRLQADPLSALGIIIPKRSSSLRQEQDLVDQRKESHAYILASSLITNSSPRDIITKSILGERVFVETILVRYKTGSNQERLLIFETPNAGSLDDAYKAGKALTRLSELYVECRNGVTSVSNSEP
jgi:hypothetical protein